MKRWLFRMTAGAGLGFLLMVPASCGAYTSFGFDLRRHDGPIWVNHMQRIQWPGDGSVRVGWQIERKPIFEDPIDRWDFGGRLLEAPERRTPRSVWNRIGFWWIDEELVHEDERLESFWIGVPNWLPALCLLAIPGCALWRRRAAR